MAIGGGGSPAIAFERSSVTFPPPPPPAIKEDMAQLAQLIAQMEGYFAPGDNWAKRNNNPGNLRAGAGQVGSAGGFAVFATPEAGWAALDRQIQIDANRGLTLEQFINKYAPPSENNTTNYLAWLSSGLSVDPSTPLLAVVSPPGEALAQASLTQSQKRETELAKIGPQQSQPSNQTKHG